MSSGDPVTRKRILEKTWHLMEKRKGQGVNISDIARAAGISRQAVYLHFGSRAELLVATVRYVDEVNRLEERLQSLRTAVGAIETLDAYLEFWGNYIPEIYGLAKALLAIRETDRDAAAAWNDRMDALRQGWCSALDCLVREGLLAPEWDLERAADTASAITSIPVWENLTVEQGWSTDEYIIYMKRILKKILIKS